MQSFSTKQLYECATKAPIGACVEVLTEAHMHTAVYCCHEVVTALQSCAAGSAGGAQQGLGPGRAGAQGPLAVCAARGPPQPHCLLRRGRQQGSYCSGRASSRLASRVSMPVMCLLYTSTSPKTTLPVAVHPALQHCMCHVCQNSSETACSKQRRSPFLLRVQKSVCHLHAGAQQ